jgi:hypothetical protein
MELDHIRESIRQMAGRRHNVTLSEIKAVLKELGRHGFEVHSRPAGDHAQLFQVNDRTFAICTHRRGSRQLKAAYVSEFLKAMIEVGMYE